MFTNQKYSIWLDLNQRPISRVNNILLTARSQQKTEMFSTLIDDDVEQQKE